MKKVVLSLVLVAGVIAANAQPRAIGVRFGYTTDVSYQHSLGSKNMLQLDAGFPGFSGFQVVGTYNWLIPISSWQHAGSWNLYAGGGAGFGLGWRYGYNEEVYVASRKPYDAKFHGTLGVVGMFGAEYNFKFPLQVFADFRPLIGAVGSKNGVRFHTRGLFEFAVGARYRF